MDIDIFIRKLEMDLLLQPAALSGGPFELNPALDRASEPVEVLA